MLKLPFGRFWVVLWRCWLDVRRMDPSCNTVHFEGCRCRKKHSVGSLSARFKVLGPMSLNVHRIANLEQMRDLQMPRLVGSS